MVKGRIPEHPGNSRFPARAVALVVLISALAFAIALLCSRGGAGERRTSSEEAALPDEVELRADPDEKDEQPAERVKYVVLLQNPPPVAASADVREAPLEPHSEPGTDDPDPAEIISEFESQPRDAAWAVEFERFIRDDFETYVRDRGLEGVRLASAECRSTTCRVELTYASEDLAVEIQRDLQRNAAIHAEPCILDSLGHGYTDSEVVQTLLVYCDIDSDAEAE